VLDEKVAGQAVCNLSARSVKMGSTSVTGDFRHELGHAMRSAFAGDNPKNQTPMTTAVAYEHDQAMQKVTKNPPKPLEKLSHDEYELRYGVVGRRSLDNWEEDCAEHYRLYHREVYRDLHEGGNGKYLAQYRARHPGWAKIWDAHYTAALLGGD
jgi:hypothetical protein